MSQLKLSGDASGTGIVTVAAPNTNSTYTVTLPAAAGTLARTDAAQTFTGVQTFSSDASVNGLTVGRGAGAVSTNTAVGASALNANTIGASNTALGAQSLYSNTAASGSTAVGYQAAYTGNKEQLVAIGFQALYSGQAYCTAVGYQAMRLTTGASESSDAFGWWALYQNTTGSANLAVGAWAMQANTIGSYNIAIGKKALYTNTTASYNTAVGYQALYASNRTADTNGYNTAIGYGSGSAITTGQKNTIIGGYTGNQGGLDIRTSSNNIVLSDGDGNPNFISGYLPTAASTYLAATRVVTMGLGGSSATRDGNLFLNGSTASGWGPCVAGRADGTQAWFVGSYSVLVSGTNQYLTCMNTSGGVYLNGASATSWTAVSDETRKVIIEPITDAANKVATLRTVIGRLKTDEEDVRRPYLIAQDVQAVLPEAVSETEDRDGPVLGLSYTETIPLLVAAIKELNTRLRAAEAEIAALKGA